MLNTQGVECFINQLQQQTASHTFSKFNVPSFETQPGNFDSLGLKWGKITILDDSEQGQVYNRLKD